MATRGSIADWEIILVLSTIRSDMMKGWIALDIDGTITQDKYSVPRDVVNFLRESHLNGWKIALATGRAFVFAAPVLDSFDFPYIILAQNGSAAIGMPTKNILFKRYMKSRVISDLEAAYAGMDTDFIIYSGHENNDRCYYRPQRFSKEDRLYLDVIAQREKEPWVPVDSFEIEFDIPLIKCLGRIDTMKKIGSRLLKTGHFQVSLIRDPFHPSYFILLVTDIKASKGASLREICSLEGRGDLIIAAGDDENDISLLQAADVKIAMPHAPEVLRKIADFIAPPVSEMGIIQALKIVITNADSRRKT